MFSPSIWTILWRLRFHRDDVEVKIAVFEECLLAASKKSHEKKQFLLRGSAYLVSG